MACHPLGLNSSYHPNTLPTSQTQVARDTHVDAQSHPSTCGTSWGGNVATHCRTLVRASNESLAELEGGGPSLGPCRCHVL